MDRQIKLVENYLPPALAAEISGYGTVDEIRLRAGGRCSLSADGENIPLSYYADISDIGEIYRRLCRNSEYSQAENAVSGYVLTAEGIRVGVCGSAVCGDGGPCRVTRISSLNIRIPHDVFGSSRLLYEYLKGRGFSDSVLICSPPGVGKTTLLRDLARSASCGKDALRVCVADERGELRFENRESMADFYFGYPKARAVSAAVRTMSPQLLICDEIGPEDVSAIAGVRHCGVPIIASAHAASIAELRKKPGISSLIDGGMFGVLVCISRKRGAAEFSYEIEEMQ